MPRWRVYLRLGRVSNLPTVWTDVLAGATLAGVAPSAASALLLGAAVSLFYVGGMFLNDAFDHAVDARERPERPIPAGLVSVREVFAAGFGMLAAGAAATLAHVAVLGGSSAAVWAGLALAATIVLYNVWHKGNPLGPVLMGLCRALVYVLAALAVAGRLPTAVLAGALALLGYLIGLTYTAKQETLGRVRNLWPLALLAAPLVYAAPAALRSPAAALLGLALLGWTWLALRPLLQAVPNVPHAVVRLIAGIALVDALLIARAGFAGLAAVAALGLPATLLLQRYVRGT